MTHDATPPAPDHHPKPPRRAGGAGDAAERAISRRVFLQSVGVAAGAAAIGGCGTFGAGGPGGASTASTASTLPVPEAWEALSRAVGGRLIQPNSPLAPCKADAPGQACAAALKQMTNPFFIEDQPGAAQSTGWLDAWDYAVSPYAVAAESADDIAAAVRFAAEHDVRLAVKGAGHDYLGRNCAPDSLLVWTHKMRDVAVHDAFVPAGAPAGTSATSALSVGAGTRWLEAYEATTKADLYVQGGGCTSVGASGGFIQGSGFGSYSKRFGTGAGGVLEFEVVTADGEVRTVNQYQEPDLFWALRGGGGGTFGIVTRTTLLAHPIPQTTGTVSGTIAAADDDAYRALIDAFIAFYPGALNNPAWGEQVRFRPDNKLELALVFLDITADQAKATWAPLLEKLRAQGDRYTIDLHDQQIPFDRVWDYRWWDEHAEGFAVLDPRPNQPDNQFWWSGNGGEVSAYWHAYHSRWVPLAMFADSPKALATMLFDASRVRHFIFQINKGLAGQSDASRARDRQTCLHPTAFDAAALIILASAQPRVFPGVPGHEPDRAKARAERDNVNRAMKIVRDALPGQGAYANEADYFTEDWQAEFWGEHYPRLLAIKQRYDPANRFRVHHGVGSDL